MMLCLTLIVFCLGFLPTRSSPFWPDGTYGLPQAIYGCPDDVTWKSGWYKQYFATQHNFGFSDVSHFNASLLENSFGLKRSFCMKTSPNNDKTNYTWPPGRFCIYKYGNTCPTGMKTDSVHWNDSKKYKNVHGGILPNGKYGNHSTSIEYCCQTNGDWDVPIELPVDKPFYLLPYRIAICQHVRFAKSSIEKIQFNTNNDKDKLKVNHVYMKKTSSSITAYYCYYKACRSTFKTATGQFSSSYTSNQYCSWIIAVKNDFLISLTFSKLKIPDCSENYLDIYDGLNQNGKLLGRYCGSNATKTVNINSTKNTLFVMLKSGRNFEGAAIKHVAFKAVYKSMPDYIQDISTTSTVFSELLNPGAAKRKENESHFSFLHVGIVVIISVLAVIIILAVIFFILHKTRVIGRNSFRCFSRTTTRKESINPIYAQCSADQGITNNPLYSSTTSSTYEEIPLQKRFLPVIGENRQISTESDVTKERHYEEPRV